MKKILCVLLTLAILCGCSAAFAQEAPTRIVFWHCMSDAAGEVVEKAVADFNATIGAENGIVVEAVYQGSYADATKKMNGILSAGNLEELPDVMQLDATGKVAYFTSGCAYTVDDLLAADPAADVSMMLDVAMGNWNYSGVQLGLPFATSTTVLLYNKTMLDAAGITAPATLSDMMNMAGKLPEGVTVYSATPNTPTLANWLGQLGSYVVNQRNGSEGNATALDCIENGALATFLSQWKALYESGVLSKAGMNSDDFVAGKLAVMTASSSSIGGNLARIGGSFELGVAYYPSVNADAAVGATVSGSCLVMFDRENKSAAWLLEKYLCGADVQAALAASSGYVPSNSKALETDTWQNLIAASPVYAVAYEQLAITPADMRSVTVGPSADFYYAIQNCVTEMLDEDLSVEETVDLMADELGGLLDQYNMANP